MPFPSTLKYLEGLEKVFRIQSSQTDKMQISVMNVMKLNCEILSLSHFSLMSIQLMILSLESLFPSFWRFAEMTEFNLERRLALNVEIPEGNDDDVVQMMVMRF